MPKMLIHTFPILADGLQGVYNVCNIQGMAIIRTPLSTPSATELSLTINNGDFEALRDTATRLGFVNEESMLRFMLAVVSKSATRSITITDPNGQKISLTPSVDLLRPITPPPATAR